MGKYKIPKSSVVVFSTILSVFSTSVDLFTKLSDIFIRIKETGAVINRVEVSWIYLVVNTTDHEYKIMNTPGCIALLGLLIYIIYEIVQMIQSKINRKTEIEEKKIVDKNE